MLLEVIVRARAAVAVTPEIDNFEGMLKTWNEDVEEEIQ
jgi:hypothetical protein